MNRINFIDIGLKRLSFINNFAKNGLLKLKNSTNSNRIDAKTRHEILYKNTLSVTRGPFFSSAMTIEVRPTAKTPKNFIFGRFLCPKN